MSFRSAAFVVCLCACSSEGLSSFDFEAFRDPPIEARPWVRWWWPGADVDSGEIRREVNLLADSFFGGAEIQAMDAALPEEGRDLRLAVHTERYFEHVTVALEEAKKRGLQIDLTLGSGWPPGGMHIKADESSKTLLYAERRVKGPTEAVIELSQPDKPVFYMVAEMGGLFGEPMSRFMPEHAHLEAVIAARVIGGERVEEPYVLTDQLLLDASSVQILTDKVSEDRVLRWQVPEGDFVVIGVFSQPDGMYPLFNAEPERGFVVDHFDAKQVEATIGRFVGEKTGLHAYYGSPLRALFIDSLELKIERFWAKDFLSEFTKRRGYDPTPWLPAVFVPGADNNLFDGLGIAERSPFGFGDKDLKIQYDWQRTASELFLERFQKTVRNFAESRGMGLRMQGYGANIDVIAAAGGATIPEAEQLYAGGADLFLKVVSSGAHLYNRNIVSAESCVYQMRDHTLTPTFIYAAVNKLFASGINHIVYHGFPYHRPDGAGEPGWHPFSSPWGGTSTYSENISQTNPFWKDIVQLNRYIARCQLALRVGAPESDVLIYYPFFGFPASLVRVEDWDENLFLGKLDPSDDAIYATQLELISALFGPPDEEGPTGWLKRVKQKLTQMHESGWSWDFVNEESLLQSEVKDGKIVIRGSSYKALIIYDTDRVTLALARQLGRLAKEGATIVFIGQTPSRDSSDFSLEDADAQVLTTIAEVLASAKKESGDAEWASILAGLGLEPAIRFNQKSPLRHVRRRLQGGGQLIFIANPEKEGVYASLLVGGGCRQPKTLDPWSGDAHALPADDAIPIQLDAFGTTFILCGIEGDAPIQHETAEFDKIPVASWSLYVDTDDVPNGHVHIEGLGDWRDNEATRYSGGPGVYRATVSLDAGIVSNEIFLDLGWLEGVAEVMVNGQFVGRLIVPPFRVEVSGLVKEGINDIEVKLIPPKRNRYVGKARAGDKQYAQFLSSPEVLAKAGLIGPVNLLVKR